MRNISIRALLIFACGLAHAQTQVDLGHQVKNGTPDLSLSAGSVQVVGIRGNAIPTLSTGCLQWNGSALLWTACSGGGGSVTTFSAGALSPLFTTSVANATTTPALSFTLSTASAHTLFGNNTGSTAAPSYFSFVAGTDYLTPTGSSTGLSKATTSAFGVVEPDGTSITISGGVISAVTGGGGTVTHSAGALTAQDCVIGNGSGDIKIDPSCSLDGSGNLTVTSIATTPSGGLGGTLTLPEGTAATAVASKDLMYADSTNHDFYVSLNGGSFFPLVSTASSPLAISASGVASCSNCGVTGSPLSQFASTSSSQLAGVISDETGTGVLVFATSPTLATPTLGVASATSVNKVTITAPATSATLTIANSKTLTANNSITLAGTDSTTMTFPSASATITQTIASGTAAMGTSAIASGACATVVTVSATGVATTDAISTGFNGDPTAVTGYGASATGAVLSIYPYPTANSINFKVCNSSSASITPGALTLNFRVVR
jgi:hypothetical protein